MSLLFSLYFVLRLLIWYADDYWWRLLDSRVELSNSMLSFNYSKDGFNL